MRHENLICFETFVLSMFALHLIIMIMYWYCKHLYKSNVSFILNVSNVLSLRQIAIFCIYNKYYIILQDLLASRPFCLF